MTCPTCQTKLRELQASPWLWCEACGTVVYAGSGSMLTPLRAKCYVVLREACKTAMHCLTGEDEEGWLKSQSYPESPYHFLYAALALDAEAKL